MPPQCLEIYYLSVKVSKNYLMSSLKIKIIDMYLKKKLDNIYIYIKQRKLRLNFFVFLQCPLNKILWLRPVILYLRLVQYSSIDLNIYVYNNIRVTKK